MIGAGPRHEQPRFFFDFLVSSMYHGLGFQASTDEAATAPVPLSLSLRAMMDQPGRLDVALQVCFHPKNSFSSLLFFQKSSVTVS